MPKRDETTHRLVDPIALTVCEVISSPTSLVSSVGVDQAKRLFGVIKSIFGPSDPFPRHSDAAAPPSRFGSNQQYAPQVLTRTGTRDTPTTMRGDQAFMLRFGRAGSNGLNVEFT